MKGKNTRKATVMRQVATKFGSSDVSPDLISPYEKAHIIDAASKYGIAILSVVRTVWLKNVS